jgi:hypothetical protein
MIASALLTVRLKCGCGVGAAVRDYGVDAAGMGVQELRHVVHLTEDDDPAVAAR